MPGRISFRGAGQAGLNLLTDFSDLARVRFASRESPDPAVNRAVEAVRREGYVVIPGYWNADRTESLRRDLLKRLAAGENQDYENGAYLRFKKGRAYDQGVARIFHADRIHPEVLAFRNDPFVMEVAGRVFAAPFFSVLTIYQHNADGTDGATTRGYHIDGFHKELKSFLYLEDVDEASGPFTYVPGSHRNQFLRLKKSVFRNGDDPPTTIRPEEFPEGETRERMLTGTAGTLIIADTRGVHRGAPQRGRSRSVLVNYLYHRFYEYNPER
jgi:hypothetical protein